MDKSSRTLAVLMLSAALGAGLWGLSPLLIGKDEPWDGTGWYYPLGLFVSGMLGTLPWPSRFFLVPLGVYIGQVTYAGLFLPIGPLALMGMVAGAIYLIFVLAGAVTTWVIVCMIEELIDRSSSKDVSSPFE
jgi:hypothetical protein